jgi:hypothetical protein
LQTRPKVIQILQHQINKNENLSKKSKKFDPETSKITGVKLNLKNLYLKKRTV